MAQGCCDCEHFNEAYCKAGKSLSQIAFPLPPTLTDRQKAEIRECFKQRFGGATGAHEILRLDSTFECGNFSSKEATA